MSAFAMLAPGDPNFDPLSGWRIRAPGTRRPRLAASVITRDSGARLADLIAQLRGAVDEILVGVDAESSDETLDVARGGADVVYRFRHSGEISPARLLGVTRTTCEWMLLLDDDEGLDEMFPSVVPELLADPRHTHWWLPRRWVTQREPPLHVADGPWFPDWQLRLFRADPTLLWKPIGVHTGLRVQGLGGRDPRTAILHYEPLLLAPAKREAKLARYRTRGSGADSETLYAIPADVATAPLPDPPLTAGHQRRGPDRAREEPDVIDLDDLPRLPPWSAAIDVELPATMAPGEIAHARVSARNDGGLTWPQLPAPLTNWPLVQLGLRTRPATETGFGRDGPHFPLPRMVEPGETALFLCPVRAPEEPGDYVLIWDMVSEFECWFSDAGGTPAEVPLRVTVASGGADE
jgi:hypothetical protein